MQKDVSKAAEITVHCAETAAAVRIIAVCASRQEEGSRREEQRGS